MAYDYNEDAMVSDRLEDRDASDPGEWKRPAGDTQRKTFRYRCDDEDDRGSKVHANFHSGLD
jgi:hypothetical protein